MIPAHKVRRTYSLDKTRAARLDRWAAASRTHHGQIIESALDSHWKEHVMPSITYWTYEADCHCTDCAEAKFGPSLPEQSQDFIDSEGNPPHPVFSTDEHLHEGEDCQLPVHCGSCGVEILAHPSDEFCAPDVVADGAHGGYDNLDYVDRILSYLGRPFDVPPVVRKALQDRDWGNAELESVIVRANNWLACGTGRHCLAWSDHESGVLVLTPVDEESDSLL